MKNLVYIIVFGKFQWLLSRAPLTMVFGPFNSLKQIKTIFRAKAILFSMGNLSHT